MHIINRDIIDENTKAFLVPMNIKGTMLKNIDRAI
jgi:hypothetical protein